MNISLTGIHFIKEFEGFSSVPYQDVAGIWTWGYGHAQKLGESIPDSISRQEAEALMHSDLEPACNGVSTCVKVPINDNQFSALVSFTYNCGVGALRSSTLLKKLNAGDIEGTENEFVKWNKAGGNVVAGLTRRREAEARLFSTPL
jgi:lysozyme